jgi:type I restriction enzyme M protein
LSTFDSKPEAEQSLKVSLEEIKNNDYSLNYKNYKDFEDDGEETPPPEELITELLSLQETIKENSESILEELEENE